MHPSDSGRTLRTGQDVRRPGSNPWPSLSDKLCGLDKGLPAPCRSFPVGKNHSGKHQGTNSRGNFGSPRKEVKCRDGKISFHLGQGESVQRTQCSLCQQSGGVRDLWEENAKRFIRSFAVCSVLIKVIFNICVIFDLS